MDRFEQAVISMAKMSPHEGKKAIEAVKGKCICGQCLSYTGAAKSSGEGFFCGTGKSFWHITTEVNCICGRCPNKSDLGLKYGFFCNRGSEKALRYDQALSKK